MIILYVDMKVARTHHMAIVQPLYRSQIMALSPLGAVSESQVHGIVTTCASEYQRRPCKFKVESVMSMH
jgi:hypothetical protein